MDQEFIAYSELMEYLQHLKQRAISQRTIQSYLIGIAHYFEYLKGAGVIETNPARYLTIHTKQTRKLYPILKKEQLENVYLNFAGSARRNTTPTANISAIRNKIVTGLMVYQGLDVSALAGLQKEDVNTLEGTITIQSSRTSAKRVLALQSRQIIELDRYMSQTRKELQTHFNEGENNFLLIHGYTHYRDTHKRLIQRLRKQEPELQATHQIRTSVITHWLKQYNLREVQYMAGHKHVHSTEAYRQNDMESLQQDIDRFHPMR